MKKPYGIVFCNASDHDFECCDSGCGIRAVGNFDENHKDEELWIKHCQLHFHPLGTCGHQAELSNFPRTPIFFLGKAFNQHDDIAKFDRIVNRKIKEYRDQDR